MTADQKTIARLVDLIRAEYQEMPGLSLTRAQIQRLWRLDALTCDVVINTLVLARVLRKTARNGYVLANAGGY